MRHFLNTEDMTLDYWDELYALFESITANPDEFRDMLKGRVMASLFYEPSTRTSFSFQAAMQRLGGSVFGFSDPNASSVAKGETLGDTVRICASYSDVIVMRTPWEGSALAASLYSEVPIINAGDGGHLHPTQTLTDLATISRLRGNIRGLNVGLCGDLKNGRTVHSLIMALAKFPDINFCLISPRELALPSYVIEYMQEKDQKYIEVTGLDATMPQLDILYMTRIQKERFTDPLEYERNKGVYVLTKRKLERARKDLLVMHPLPRVDEIAPDVDADPRAVYFKQVRFGMFIRMALLYKLCETGRQQTKPPLSTLTVGGTVCKNPRCITQNESFLPELVIHKNSTKRYCAFCEKEITEV